MLADAQTLLLDMDGTLLDLDFDNHFWNVQVPQALAEARGEPLERVRQDLFAAIKAAEGTLDWYCLDYWSRQLDFDLIAFKRTVTERIRFLDGASEFLERARASGRRLILVTNAHPDTLAIKDEVTDVTAMMDAVICSHHIGLPKEDARFWPVVLAQLQHAPEGALLVDDSPAVLATASQFVPVIAIAKPDSQRPSRDMAPHKSVERIDELWVL
ncbi:MAG: HAD-IA family hydrolase [Pseudomonadota bacterium]